MASHTGRAPDLLHVESESSDDRARADGNRGRVGLSLFRLGLPIR